VSHRRSPRAIGLTLDGPRERWAPPTLLGAIQGGWEDVVGPSIAAQATPVGERGGVLTISCSASVWAQELDLMGPVILERLGTLLGGDRISRIRCIAVPAGGGEWTRRGSG
jgi:predicted nucleic acid-binding Zn ribbon protein